MESWKNFLHKGMPWWLSVGAGAALGCIYRLTFNGNGRWPVLTMTLGFLILVPIAMGYVAVDHYLRRASDEVCWYDWFFLPWLSVFITMAVSVAVKWEGAICLIFAAPIMLVSSLIGGILARVLSRRYTRSAPGQFSAVAFPLIVILVESHISAPVQIRSVETDMLIHAPASVVWENIRSVRAINSSELPDSWATRIGFPKPVAATLSHDGVGGVRQASFTGGLIFTETIKQWEPESDLKFSIHANTDSIPPTTLDEHVTIGGAFFDVLDGEYRLEKRPDGILLRLSSRERLSTHLNPYAGAWTDAVMRSIQNQILAVIRRRCEAGDTSPSTIAKLAGPSERDRRWLREYR
jgi:hypothetical protein